MFYNYNLWVTSPDDIVLIDLSIEVLTMVRDELKWPGTLVMTCVNNLLDIIIDGGYNGK